MYDEQLQQTARAYHTHLSSGVVTLTAMGEAPAVGACPKAAAA